MNKYLNAVSANLFFFVINTVFFLAIIPASIRLMGDEFYGLWSILYALTLLTSIGTLGISPIITKFASEFHSDKVHDIYIAEVITAGGVIILPMAALVAIVLFLLRNLLATHLITDPVAQNQFSNALILVSISMFPEYLSVVAQGFLLSQLKYRISRQIDVFTAITLWLGTILIVYLLGKNITWVGAWCLVNSLINFFLYYFATRRLVNNKIHINLPLVRKMLNFSGFMFIESTAISMFQQLDRVIVGFTLGPALAGVYSVGTSIGLRLSMITGQVTSVMVPYASLKDSVNDHERLFGVFRKLSSYVSLIMAGIGGVLVLWMGELLSLWISPSYSIKYSDPFRIIIIAYALFTLSRPGHQTLTGLGKVKFTSLVYMVSTLAMLGGLFALSHLFGLPGAAWANAILGLLLVYNLYTYHLLAHRIPWKSVLSDLQWGLLVPLVTYFVVGLQPSLILKLLITLLLVFSLLFIFYRDEWVRSWFSTALKQMRQKIPTKVKVDPKPKSRDE